MKRHLACCVVAFVSLQAGPSAAFTPDDGSEFGLSDVSGALPPERCGDKSACRILDLSGRQVGPRATSSSLARDRNDRLAFAAA